MDKDRKVVKWKLEDLRPHPRQSELFPDLNDDELAMLASDMELNGLEVPIEITSSGEIIAGNQRVRAARKLEWTEIDALVRSDLEALGSQAILAQMIESNLIRRPLDKE